MEIRTKREGANVIVNVEGRLDGNNAMEFVAALERAVRPTDRGVIMDMADLGYISSRGLEAILVIAKSLQKQNTRLLGCSLSDPVRKVFTVSGFDKIVTICSSRADALQVING